MFDKDFGLQAIIAGELPKFMVVDGNVYEVGSVSKNSRNFSYQLTAMDEKGLDFKLNVSRVQQGKQYNRDGTTNSYDANGDSFFDSDSAFDNYIKGGAGYGQVYRGLESGFNSLFG